MYLEVISPLLLCPILSLMYLSGTIPVLFRFVAKLWYAQVEVGFCSISNSLATFAICLRMLLLYLCITHVSLSAERNLLIIGNTCSPSLGSLAYLSCLVSRNHIIKEYPNMCSTTRT